MKTTDEGGSTMNRRILILAGSIAVLAAAAAFGTAATTSAAPKPGFTPGTWVGTGTIKGYSVDGPMSTHFDGGIAFTLKVNKQFGVSGTGTWALNMLGSEDAPSDYAVDSTMRGIASIKLGGTSTGITFSGLQKITGEIRSAGVGHPISMERPLNGRLTIVRAGKCLVRGATAIQQDVTLTWSAKLKGSGKCNA
jgi:hypothetical protein